MLSFENPALKTENLQVYYGDHHAFFDGNLEFEKNKITALIGPSGCGKSTFLRSLNRMNDKVADVTGKIWYRGVDINAKDINVYEVRKHIGMVFQRPNPFAKSIRENITYALKANGLNDKEELDKRVEESLKQAALWNEVIIVTHNMQQASRISDYTAFFHLGRVIEYDKTENIFQTPHEKLTEDYVSGNFG